ncbi:hypothetical protein KSP40_PGU007435 [Platanthera guangdongensis]|uniref:AAA+ ATPase At3g28540-like C-terminal domain-containing protein n=1 Tax=Platanthera guangdongensis TaxID=2320717 RepID=A0ABR2LL74_9ASPA
MLNFMDIVFSYCAEERVMVFTASSKNTLDPTVIRPGRLDVQIHFPFCDFTAFKTLASNYLGLKYHKLYQQGKKVFGRGQS